MTYYEVKKVSGSGIWFNHLVLYCTVSPIVRLHASSLNIGVSLFPITPRATLEEFLLLISQFYTL